MYTANKMGKLREQKNFLFEQDKDKSNAIVGRVKVFTNRVNS
jgi:hypothetical protein